MITIMNVYRCFRLVATLTTHGCNNRIKFLCHVKLQVLNDNKQKNIVDVR